jgi:hypothetical protein
MLRYPVPHDGPGDMDLFGTQIGLGPGLLYGLVKSFDTVGKRLNDDTRLEIAVWLLGVPWCEGIIASNAGTRWESPAGGV